MERSVYIIKPEAVSQKEKIHELIEAGGLQIVAVKLAILDEGAVSILYPNLSRDLRDATLHFFGLGPCEIGVVKGEDAVLRLSALAGASINPAECEPTTIRGRFGSRVPARPAAAVYYLNGFHRSKDASEVDRDLALFETLPLTRAVPSLSSNADRGVETAPVRREGRPA
jgi:nucleoside diphosphate kinase